MMALTQKTLRGILAKVLSVDEKLIIPKQGNWWNPQENANKPATWCAYMIRSNVPRTVPFYTSGNEGKTNCAVTEKIATIDLQFVGTQSEELAQSVALWPLRSDVQDAFAEVRGAVMNDSMEAVSSNFYQDGNNTVLAWNVTFRVLWYHVIDTAQGKMEAVLMDGKINKGL